MRGVSKQNAIKRARLKFIKISSFQNKAFASEWPKMRDRRLATKVNVRDGKLQINTMLKAKLIKGGISELSLIITVNGFQEVEMLIVQPQGQAPKVLKHFILALQEENLRVMRIVINDDKNVPLTSYGVNPRGIDSVHME
jgi:hypothetical protein